MSNDGAYKRIHELKLQVRELERKLEEQQKEIIELERKLSYRENRHPDSIG